MNWFKRLCMFLFGLSGVLSLAALSLVWVGPWTTQARSLILENQWYFLVLEVLVCVSGVGLLGCMIVSLFAPRNPKETIVASVTGGDITVTRAAIQSQARHIIEADGTCEPVSVRVRVRKRGRVRVHARVRPHLPVDVVARGEILYAELEQGLAMVCGDSIKSIGLVFTEPEQRGTLSVYVDTDETPHADSAASGSGAPRDITVPMSAPAEAQATVPAESVAAADAEPAAEVEPSDAPTLTLDQESEQDEALEVELDSTEEV